MTSQPTNQGEFSILGCTFWKAYALRSESQFGTILRLTRPAAENGPDEVFHVALLLVTIGQFIKLMTATTHTGELPQALSERCEYLIGLEELEGLAVTEMTLEGTKLSIVLGEKYQLEIDENGIKVHGLDQPSWRRCPRCGAIELYPGTTMSDAAPGEDPPPQLTHFELGPDQLTVKCGICGYKLPAQ
jgi:hypothetical protein